MSPLDTKETGHDSLTDALLGAMIEAWCRGERPGVEDLVALVPHVAEDGPALAALVEWEKQLHREWEAADRTDHLTSSLTARPVPAPLAGEFSEATIAPPIDLDPPEVGEDLGEFRLEAILGQGVRGTVFLASDRTLGDRPVVLKVTPRDGAEHLILARLQHPNIVPVHSMRDVHERGLRLLCMPYLGGAPLSRLLGLLRRTPLEERTGGDLVRAMETVELLAPLGVPTEGPTRRFLAQTSYDRALAWFASCLADGLHAAHRRQLVHLDVKPSNILIASDGRPMLLDFHLARSPIRAGACGAEGLGGTPTYMPPEQRAAFQAVREGRPIPKDVDGRADIFSLGLVLHEALGGPKPLDREELPRPRMSYPGADPGLAAIIARCLEPDPGDRYPDAASLASDLRRYLADQPLAGVASRTGRKRLRSPHFARSRLLGTAMLVAVIAVASLSLVAWNRIDHATAAAEAARAALMRGDSSQALREAETGLVELSRTPLAEATRGVLVSLRARAERAVIVAFLHKVADAARRLDVADSPPPAELKALDLQLNEAWGTRQVVLNSGPLEQLDDAARRVQDDLVDIAIARASLRRRLAPANDAARAEAEMIRILEDAEASLGPDPILRRELALISRNPGSSGVVPTWQNLDTARSHDASGRSYLRSGDLEAALAEFDRVIEIDPRDLWAHFHRGVCAYRLGRFADAAEAFGVCEALGVDRPEFAFNRALALAAHGDDDRAVREYDHAIRLDPASAPARLNRGLLHFRSGRLGTARDDLRRALELGADPSLVHYNLALIDRAEGHADDALANVRAALERDPSSARAAELARSLRAGNGER